MKNLLNRILVIACVGLFFGMTGQAWNVSDVNGVANESNSFKKGRWSLELVCEETISPDGTRTRKCRLVIIKESTSRASLMGVLNIDSRRSTATLTNVETEDQKEPLVVDEEIVLNPASSRIFGFKSVTILPNRYEIKKGGTINLKFKGTEPIVVKPSQTLKSRLDKADEYFAVLENLLTKIETSKNVEEADLDTFDRAAMELAKTLKTAFDEVSASAQLASRTQGKEGNVTDLEYFEDQAERHIKKANLIAKKTEEINNAVERKRIICVPCELRDRRVTSENIFSDKTPSIFVNANFSTAENSSACEGTAGSESNNLFSAIGSRSKSAAVACVSPCSSLNWGVCKSCLANAVSTGVGKFNQFMSSWNGCASKKREWQRKACRAAALASFVYWIY